MLTTIDKGDAVALAEEETRTEMTDAVRILLYAAAALVITGVATALRVLGTFREQGVAWSIPVDEMVVSATVDSGAASVEGVAQTVLVFADDLDSATLLAIAGSITLWAAAALVLILGAAVIAGNFLRARFFVKGNALALSFIAWTLCIAPLVIVVLEVTARNGVMASVGLGTGEPLHPIEFWSTTPLLLAGITVGLIARGLRRGVSLAREKERLQKETEGLV